MVYAKQLISNQGKCSSSLMEDVENMDKYVIVTLPQTNNLTRSSIITDDGCRFEYIV